MITNKNYNVDLASLHDNKLLYDFAKEMIQKLKVINLLEIIHLQNYLNRQV